MVKLKIAYSTLFPVSLGIALIYIFMLSGIELDTLTGIFTGIINQLTRFFTLPV